MASSFEEHKTTRKADQLAHDEQIARALAAEEAGDFEVAERDEERSQAVPGNARGRAFPSGPQTVSRSESKEQDASAFAVTDPGTRRNPLTAASLASEAHSLDRLREKYDDIVKQPWGFSVAKVSDQENDLKQINDYINKYNAHIKTLKPGEPIGTFKHTVSHQPGLGKKIEYTLENGRVYSTHEDSGQLYPLRGPGVATGNGPIDMAHVLSELGELDDERAIRLAEIHTGMQTDEYQKAAKEKREKGRHSGVELPRIATTSSANIKKMNPLKRQQKGNDARQRLLEEKTSAQHTNALQPKQPAVVAERSTKTKQKSRTEAK